MSITFVTSVTLLRIHTSKWGTPASTQVSAVEESDQTLTELNVSNPSTDDTMNLAKRTAMQSATNSFLGMVKDLYFIGQIFILLANMQVFLPETRYATAPIDFSPASPKTCNETSSDGSMPVNLSCLSFKA